MFFEEGARPGAIGNLRRPRRTAGLAQRNPQGFWRCGQRVLRGDRLAAYTKRQVGREMIVVAPAGDIGEGQGNILAAADLERKGEARIWNETGVGNRARIGEVTACGARAVYGERNQ
jgi:hypothetical protein